MNIHERLIERIDNAMPSITNVDDRDKLDFIRSSITETALKTRDPRAGDTRHLREVAHYVLKNYDGQPRQEADPQ